MSFSTRSGQTTLRKYLILEIPPKDRRALHVRSKRLFAGDYAQDPLPRLLTQDEFQFLSRGVEQRARAILAFLRDYCVKGSRWNRIMPASTLHTMIARHHMGNLLRKINPDQLRFPTAPISSVTRLAAGAWSKIALVLLVESEISCMGKRFSTNLCQAFAICCPPLLMA